MWNPKLSLGNLVRSTDFCLMWKHIYFSRLEIQVLAIMLVAPVDNNNERAELSDLNLFGSLFEVETQ